MNTRDLLIIITLLLLLALAAFTSGYYAYYRAVRADAPRITGGYRTMK